MNGYIPRPKLVAVAFCLAVFLVVGVGYAIPAELCEEGEQLLDRVTRMINNCEENCEDLWRMQGEITCALDLCWDLVEGEGACPAGA